MKNKNLDKLFSNFQDCKNLNKILREKRENNRDIVAKNKHILDCLISNYIHKYSKDISYLHSVIFRGDEFEVRYFIDLLHIEYTAISLEDFEKFVSETKKKDLIFLDSNGRLIT